MRLAILTQYYPPEMGAPQARLSELAKYLVQCGHEVYVLTAMPNYPVGRIFSGYGGLYQREQQDGVHIARTFIYPTKSAGLLRRLLNYFSFALSSLLIGIFLLPKVDYLMTESPPLFLGISGWLLAKLKRAAWIMNVSDLWPDSAKYIGMFTENSFAYKVLRRMAFFFYQRAWLVTGQSKEIVAEIQTQVPTAKVYHLSNGVDLENFHPSKQRGEIREKYLKEGEVGFVYAGLHGLFQGLDQVLSAAALLNGDRIRFVFLGDGPEKESLVKKCLDLGLENVDFYSPLPHEQIPPVIASMDVAVVSLKTCIRGAVPSKIYEGMSSGVPVLLVGNGEAGEIIQRAQAGLAVAPGDAEKIARTIRMLATNLGWRREMGRCGREAAERLFDRAKIAERFEAVLSEGNRNRD